MTVFVTLVALPILFIVLALALIAVIWAVSTVNGFKRKEIKIDECLSGIEVALTKRYDLLTKLLDTAKGYMSHEEQLFTKVIALRRGMSAEELQDADKQINEMSAKFFAVAEGYPELKSAQIFSDLQAGIRDAEDHLQAARRLYNAAVTSYNTSIAMFPASLLAGGRVAKSFFAAEEHKREDVKISF